MSTFFSGCSPFQAQLPGHTAPYSKHPHRRSSATHREAAAQEGARLSRASPLLAGKMHTVVG